MYVYDAELYTAGDEIYGMHMKKNNGKIVEALIIHIGLIEM